MNTILVSTDFTIRTGAAAGLALQPAIESQANLVLCNVIEPNSRFFIDVGCLIYRQRELKKR